LSTLLVLRGAIPGIHGRELLRREMPRKKEGGDARRRCIAYSNVKEPLCRHASLSGGQSQRVRANARPDDRLRVPTFTGTVQEWWARFALPTRHRGTHQHSRDTNCPSDVLFVVPLKRGRREDRMLVAPAASCASVESTRVRNHRFNRSDPAFPAQWF